MTEDLFSDLPIADGPVIPDHRQSRDAGSDPFDIPTEKASEPSRSGRLFQLAGKRERVSEDKPGSRTRKTTAKTPPPPNLPGQFVEPLTDLYNMLGIVAMPLKPRVAMVLMSPAKEGNETTVAQDCAIAWDEAAQKNESIRRALKTLTTVGVYGALFVAHAPIMLALVEDTPLAAKFNPAAAMEQYLKEQAETSGSDSDT